MIYKQNGHISEDPEERYIYIHSILIIIQKQIMQFHTFLSELL